MAIDTQQRDLCSARIVELSDERVVLAIPGTSYQLHLVPGVPATEFGRSVGDRVRGRIEGVALRLHPAEGGGRFIEPVWGHPRIVAGTVLDADAEAERVLVDVAVPMWVSTPPQQDFAVIQPGRLVNFYIESGVRFTPVESAE